MMSKTNAPEAARSASDHPMVGGAPLPQTPLFGTDGIRGRVGDVLNAPFAVQVGFWAGQVFQKLGTPGCAVVIGQDSRNSSDMLAQAIAGGLTSAGVQVWHLGLCPTPCVSYVVSQTEAGGGIMISASHNPPEDNGIKFFGPQGTKLEKDHSGSMEAGIRGQWLPHDLVTPAKPWGQAHYRPHLLNHYTDFLQQSIAPATNFKGLKVVLDLAWGSAVSTAAELFQSLGAEVITLHDQAQGDRINVNCGSTHLDVLQRAVKDHGADLGFAFDGDADRVMAIDHEGNIVDGDYILYLWGQHLKERGQLPNNLIIATVMANLGFERSWEQAGGTMIRTAVGDQHVQAEMWRTGAMLGGEQSGHILCHHHSLSGDGVQTALHLTALVSETGASLRELLHHSFTPYPQLLKNVRVEDRDRRCHWQQCDPLMAAIAKAEAAMGDQGRILVRPSGTEPLIRVMVEAAEADLAHYWTNHLVQMVQTHLAA